MNLQKKHIPNILTIIRIVLVPIIVILVLVPSNQIVYCYSFHNIDYQFSINYLIAAILFVLASLTDALDGYLARRNKWISNFGKLWDPIADKILINSVLICFACKNTTFAWIPIIMISRDVIVDALRAYAISQKREIAANIFGKLKTIFQMIAIFVIFFLFNSDQVNQRLNYYLFQNLGMYLALIFSILSGVIYFVKYTKKVQTPK